jgi:hypothetical protein
VREAQGGAGRPLVGEVEMICAVCLEPVDWDGPRGYVHHDGRTLADDGHPATPIRSEALPRE